MAGPPISRQLALTTLDALKKAGHIVLAPGGSDPIVRDFVTLIDPVLARIVSKLDRSPIMGEVSSTFGDEATDEAVEELVSAMREALLDSDGVEDVFADDRTIERFIFRTLADAFRVVAATTIAEDEDDRPPISVRLDTLGYVAAAAAKSADDDTLRDALDRAAEAAQSELKTFDDRTRTAFFRPVDPDPERRLDIEAAIEEELSDLVDLGVVELPTTTRTIPLAALAGGEALSDARRKALRRTLDELAQKHLGIPLCPGTWDWSEDKQSVVIVFTPLTEPDSILIERAVLAVTQGIEAFLRAPFSEDAPTSVKPRSQRADDLAFVTRVLQAARVQPAKSEAPASSKPPAKVRKEEPAPKTKRAKTDAPKAAPATSAKAEGSKPKRPKKS